ncbi:MAG: MXAN_2561 family MXYO-CTERM-anchored protein [Myxococcota bacterium]
MNRLALLALLMPALALAQITTGSFVQTQVNARDELTFGPGECEAPIQVTWSVGITGVVCSDLEVWVTPSTSCGEKPGDNDFKFQSLPPSLFANQRTGTFVLRVRELPAFSSPNTAVCGDAGLEKEHRVCAAFTLGTFDCVTSQRTVLRPASPAMVSYDSLPPQSPVVSSVTAGDRSITVTFSTDADTVVVDAEVKKQTESDFHVAASSAPSSFTVRIDDLENNAIHEVRLVARDKAGNVSAPSATFSATPLHTQGFFEVYRRAGGTDQGCTAAGGGMLASAALLAARLFSRRKSS